MEKIPPTINVGYDGVSYVIYDTCDDSTCMNCRKPGHVAKNRHTRAQSNIGSITFADLAAGWRVTTPLHNTVPALLAANTRKGTTTTTDNTTTFLVPTQPRQRLHSTDSANVTAEIQFKPHVTDNTTPKIKQPQTHTDDLKQEKENYQASENIDNATVENCVERPTPHTSETKKTSKIHKQKQSSHKETWTTRKCGRQRTQRRGVDFFQWLVTCESYPKTWRPQPHEAKQRCEIIKL
jgi:hypothetical protein